MGRPESGVTYVLGICDVDRDIPLLSELTNTSVGAMRLFIGTGGPANESATKTEDAVAESRNARIAAKSLSLCDPEVLAAC